MKCIKCGVDMELQPYKTPFISVSGKVIHNELCENYICPCCGREVEIPPLDEDGYSAGQGLFNDD